MDRARARIAPLRAPIPDPTMRGAQASRAVASFAPA